MLVLLLVVAAVVNSVCGLDCFATDITALKHGQKQEIQQDCKENIRQSLAMQGKSGDLPSDVPITCYKLDIDTGVRVIVKGCMPKGGCGVMKEAYKLSLGITGQSYSMDCLECNGNYCNGGNSRYKVGLRFGLLVTLLALIRL